MVLEAGYSLAIYQIWMPMVDRLWGDGGTFTKLTDLRTSVRRVCSSDILLNFLDCSYELSVPFFRLVVINHPKYMEYIQKVHNISISCLRELIS